MGQCQKPCTPDQHHGQLGQGRHVGPGAAVWGGGQGVGERPGYVESRLACLLREQEDDRKRSRRHEEGGAADCGAGEGENEHEEQS